MSELISAGASILGGLIGRKGHDAGGNSSLAIRGQAHGARWAAEQFGFNPLTLLGVSSAVAGSQDNTVLGQGIANAGLAIADGINQKKMLEIERQKVAQDQKRLDALIEKQTLRPKVGGIYTQQIGTPSTGGVGSPDVEVMGTSTANRPKPKPTLGSDGYIPVFGPDGGRMQIPAKVANRLDVKPWDAFIVEDYEGILGDEFGQIVAAPKIPAGAMIIEGGVFGQRTPEERDAIIANPYSLRNYLPTIKAPTNNSRGAIQRKRKLNK